MEGRETAALEPVGEDGTEDPKLGQIALAAGDKTDLVAPEVEVPRAGKPEELLVR
jgi:hypothetical protein